MTTLLRIFKFAAQNFKRNLWLSLATTAVMALTLISVNLLVVLNIVGKNVVKMVEDRIDVSVYFKPQTSDEVVMSARSTLLAQQGVKEIQFIGRDLALQKFRDRHKTDPAVIAALDELKDNPLGASLLVRADDPSRYEAILGALDNPIYKGEILEKSFEDHRALINKLGSVTAKVERSALALSAIFGLIVILIVVNSVRVAIYTRREEIGIMKLVGASNWFVRAPFLLEAAFAGFLALALSTGVLVPGVRATQPFLARFLGSDAINLVKYLSENGVTVFGTELAGAVLIPMLIAGMAVGRYLKV